VVHSQENDRGSIRCLHPMSAGLPDIGHVATSPVDGLEIRLARGGRSNGVPLLLTSPWPESIYAFRGILPAIEALGPLIAVDLPRPV
jgi:pimeloyl-ACP methyl ester carboxylesterase